MARVIPTDCAEPTSRSARAYSLSSTALTRLRQIGHIDDVYPTDEAMDILLQRRGTMYDPLIVDTFAAVKEVLDTAVREADPQLEVSDAPRDTEGASRLQSFDVTSMTISLVLGKPS